MHLAAVETSVMAQFPNIIAHLAVTKYEDGSPRVPGEIHLKTAGTLWSGRLKDTDGALFIPLTAPTIDDLLLMMELFLTDEKAPWQPDTFARKKGGGKGNK